MNKMLKIVVFLLILYINNVLSAYQLRFSSNSPAVLGANITIQAELLTDGKLVDGKYRATWTDNAIKPHSMVIEQNSPIFNWTVNYPRAEGYHIGTYNVQILVERSFSWFYYDILSGRTEIEVTNVLNGNLTITQNGTLRKDEFISSRLPINETIVLKKSDLNLLTHATYVRTYWFVDCIYKGLTDNYSMEFNFNEPDRTYSLEALVVASYDVIPEPTTTTPAPTTTTTTTTTTTPSTTTTTTSTTTPIPTTAPTTPPTTTTTQKAKRKRDVATANSTEELTTESVEFELTPTTNEPQFDINSIAMIRKQSVEQPFVCFNQSSVAPDPKKTYGYFNKQVTVKAPIGNVSFSGKTWLQHGEVLSLEIKCTGSPPYQYCLKFHAGEYNITGNETCSRYLSENQCNFSIVHFFVNADTFSILVILENQVSKTINKVGINVYQAQTKSPLSVIIVPISFCLVAIIIIIFGVAYYIQHRSHFLVEVADFNFGDTQSIDDMEYKTFQKRLLDSVTDIFRSTSVAATTMHSGVVGDSTLTGETSLKYGSMT